MKLGSKPNGHTDDCNIPQKVLAFQGLSVSMLAAGAEHTMAVMESGKLYGWVDVGPWVWAIVLII
jgi:alpha-tubulin suppressor-like RCC1 family protein